LEGESESESKSESESDGDTVTRKYENNHYTCTRANFTRMYGMRVNVSAQTEGVLYLHRAVSPSVDEPIHHILTAISDSYMQSGVTVD